MSEIWKDIEGYEGKYQVSNLGRVRSLDRVVEKRDGTTQFIHGTIIKPHNKVNGYKVVNLWRQKNSIHMYVHRLVAIAFIPNPGNLQEVNHKDEDKTNNHVDNLEWCSHRYNSMYNNLHNRSKANMRKQVIQLTLDGKMMAEFESEMEASRQTGFAVSHISAVCRGQKRVAYGYIWKFKNE